jgi:hypothetical protein
MFGLSVRWSLKDAPADAGDRLREYVVNTSIARFSGLDGLHQKTWRMLDHDWFEGTYVFETAEGRDQFLAGFMPGEATAPGSQIVGSRPVAYDLFEVVAIAEGGAGFVAGAGPGHS